MSEPQLAGSTVKIRHLKAARTSAAVVQHLVLIRHGQTDANKLGIVQGHTQTALNSLGLRQADELEHAVGHGRSPEFCAEAERGCSGRGGTAQVWQVINRRHLPSVRQVMFVDRSSSFGIHLARNQCRIVCVSCLTATIHRRLIGCRERTTQPEPLRQVRIGDEQVSERHQLCPA